MVQNAGRFFSYLFVGCLGAAIAVAADNMHPTDSWSLSKNVSFTNKSSAERRSKSPAELVACDCDNGVCSFSSILENARPSVVHVRVVHKPDFFEWGVDQMLRDLDSWFGQLDDSLRIHSRQLHGIHSFYEGSGAIVSADGYILTSAYLLYGAEKVQVITYDNKLYNAQVIGLDRNSGLALLKISPDKSLSPVKFSDMKNISVNQWVISLGYDDTVSHGVVRSYIPHNFVMTDTLITAKSVGGLLIDLKGNLLGLNTPNINLSNNFSLVIPADYASRVATELKQKGFVKPTYLGVVAQNLSSDLASSFKLKPNSCVLVSQVMAGSPALTAGITSGDCISDFDDHSVTNVEMFYSLVATHDSTLPASLSFWRDGVQQKVTVKWKDVIVSKETPPFHFYNLMGIYLREMLPEELEAAKTKSGLLIGNIITTGSAYRVGLRSGDIFIAMDGKALKSLSQFDDMMNSPAKSAAFLMQRKSERAFVAVDKEYPENKTSKSKASKAHGGRKSQ